jgi:hypothetical protein
MGVLVIGAHLPEGVSYFSDAGIHMDAKSRIRYGLQAFEARASTRKWDDRAGNILCPGRNEGAIRATVQALRPFIGEAGHEPHGR